MTTQETMTTQQRALLAFIVGYIRSHNGVAPSYQQMAEALGLKSKSGVHRAVKSLVERGHLKDMPRHRARCLTPVGFDLANVDRVAALEAVMEAFSWTPDTRKEMHIVLAFHQGREAVGAAR